MAGMTYIKFFVDDLESLKALTYEEKGRLYEAMLLYASTGEIFDLIGNERFVFPVMKTRIDREREDMEKRKEKSKSAARARWNKPEENEEECKNMQTDASASCDMQTDANACIAMQANANDAITNDKQQTTNDKQQTTNDKSESKRAREARFSPPSEEDVERFCQEHGLKVNAQRFVSFYASKGWKVGKESMKDWRAAVRGWALRDAQERQQMQESKPKLMSSYSAEDIAAWERMEVSCGDLRGVG